MAKLIRIIKTIKASVNEIDNRKIQDWSESLIVSVKKISIL